MNKKQEIISLAGRMNVSLDNHQAEQFIKYYEMLVEKNKYVNLTAITEWDEVLRKHFLDSMALCSYIDNKEYSVIDIGTGAGFPGIPLKIAYPALNMTLVDTLNKRVVFLEDVVSELGLQNIEVIQSRAEDLGRSEDHRMKYDFAVSRAVADLPVLLEYCTPFVKVSGMFVSYKSGNIEEELAGAGNALDKLGCVVSRSEKPDIPDSDFSRTLLFVERKTVLEDRYPRRAGIPSKRPL